jgi:hypothetical protein
VTHFVFHPLSSIDVPNVRKATVLEAVSPTENMLTGREPFKCITKPTPAGELSGSFAIDIPHNTPWEIKS